VTASPVLGALRARHARKLTIVSARQIVGMITCGTGSPTARIEKRAAVASKTSPA
jgi:hypothetical protein